MLAAHRRVPVILEPGGDDPVGVGRVLCPLDVHAGLAALAAGPGQPPERIVTVELEQLHPFRLGRPPDRRRDDSEGGVHLAELVPGGAGHSVPKLIGGVLYRLGSVESTQDEAAGLPAGSVVVADHQRSGRGRHGRAWEAPPGSGLFATFVLPPGPLVVFAAGVAAAEACGSQVRLKWPNDLILGDRKLGGVLAEVRGQKALVGVGINLSWAPEGAAMLGQERDALLDRLLPAVEHWAAARPEAIIARWRELSWTLGQEVRVELGSEVVEGIAEDVAPDGALIVAGRRVVAGDVIRVRPSS
ncbi:MAG: biotin--[acetyl-CoA-carboxylase] ligase [Chloroflexi bacterium]|nr:MAG: biotin--[acetyl-CoA-carboxylase] ligase [Chloroflexota bacterium]